MTMWPKKMNETIATVGENIADSSKTMTAAMVAVLAVAVLALLCAVTALRRPA